jgi:hypothetical protein
MRIFRRSILKSGILRGLRVSSKLVAIQIRGQIMADEGNHERKERADFHGEHYVEAYIIKDGVCVARDDIDVRVNG